MNYIKMTVLLFTCIFVAWACTEATKVENVICLTETDCPVGEICSDGICVPGVAIDGDAPWAGECKTDADCGSGYVCDDAFCIPAVIADGDGAQVPDGDDTPPVDGDEAPPVDGDEAPPVDGDDAPPVDGDAAGSCTTDEQCADGLFCNGVELCNMFNICVPGAAPCGDFDDGIWCTDPGCDEDLGACVGLPNHSLCAEGERCEPEAADAAETGCALRTACANDSECSDNIWCNGEETCVDGICRGSGPVVCEDDGIGCTEERCDENAKACVHIPSDELCSDGEACNGIEICSVDLDCQDGNPPDCNDGVDCTIDSCDSALGCKNIADHNLCEGDKICHPLEGCKDRECTVNPDCDDLDPCNGEEVCGGGICQPGTPLDCQSGLSHKHDTFTCDDGCVYLCEAEYIDCDNDLGNASGTGCERWMQMVLVGEANALTADSCTDGLSQWTDYPGCGTYSESGNEMVFSFTAPETNEYVVAAQAIDNFDLDLYVLSNPCDRTTCTDYSTASGDDYVIFDAQAGETFYIVVEGYDGGCGEFNIGAELRENTDCESSGSSQATTFLLLTLLLGLFILGPRVAHQRK